MRSALATLMLATTGAHVALTQAAPAGGTFRGRIVDQATELPLAGASVEVTDAKARQVSDSAGRFTFVALARGEHQVSVRRLGYRELTDSVTIQAGDTTDKRFSLRAIPVTLEEIVISGRTVQFPRFFESAYKRAASGKGYFFTREQIQEWNAKDFEILLNRVPGVHANERGVTFSRCMNGLDAARNSAVMPTVQVYIDGQRTTIGYSDLGGGVLSLLNSIKPHQIQIMEVYPSIGMIPGEFLADSCAVIVIWTKRD